MSLYRRPISVYPRLILRHKTHHFPEMIKNVAYKIRPIASLLSNDEIVSLAKMFLKRYHFEAKIGSPR